MSSIHRPSAVLLAAGLDPGEIARRVGLRHVDTVPVREARPWLRRLWIGDVAAITLPWAVYLRPDLLAGPAETSAPLLVHELVHVRQWRDLGVGGFTVRYLTEYLRSRLSGWSHAEAYARVSFEREARHLAGV